MYSLMKTAANKARGDGIFTDVTNARQKRRSKPQKQTSTNRVCFLRNVLVPAFTATWRKSNIHNGRKNAS